jgi:signal transduction histidine kinase
MSSAGFAAGGAAFILSYNRPKLSKSTVSPTCLSSASSAEILEDYLHQLDSAERKDHLQSIRKNTRRMSGLMEEVLLLGSRDTGKMQFKPAPLEFRTFVERLVDEVLSATNRRCPIKLSLSEIPSEIHADVRLLRPIFTNLLTNAIKYSDVGRLVRFEIGCAGGEIVCAIRDQGIGIPEADQEWLFNAFHRGQNVADPSGDRPWSGDCEALRRFASRRNQSAESLR